MKSHYFILTLFILVNSISMAVQNQQDSFFYMKNQNSFNPNAEMIGLFMSSFFDSILICNNTVAIKIFEQRIDSLTSYICDKSKNNLTKTISFILNFELMTGIESESDGDFIGKYNPTNADLINWRKWLCEYKDNLCWYEEKNILFLRHSE